MNSRPIVERERCEQVSLAVVDAVAERLDVPPGDVEPPLNDVVDPDALDALFAPTSNGDPRTARGAVKFTYANQRVEVRADGTVYVGEGESPRAADDLY